MNEAPRTTAEDPFTRWHREEPAGSRRTWTPLQAALYLLAVTALVAFAWMYPRQFPLWGGALVLVVYALVVFARTLAVLSGLLLHDVERGDEKGPDEEPWPLFTVLLPVYREAHILPDLLTALTALDYPRDRLDAIVLVEADDAETCEAAARVATSWLRVVVVPPGEPRTKPRACNVGLAAARGEFLVVFDAEDRPDPDQLKQAVRVFRRSPPGVVCLQAHLNYYNSRDNLLTRCFAVEYAALTSTCRGCTRCAA